MTGRTRNCIFCGAEFTGQKRNFEHIIPAWLVQEADLRSRDMQVELPGVSRKVAMNRIGLKVCKTCNDADSDLEGRAKAAFLAIKQGEDLADAQIHAMLDWLDKVRVGLWLWLIEQIGEEYRIGEPKFRINGRLARKDRILMVQRYPDGPPMRGLALQGLGEFFIGMPSAIGLLINNISLTSISSDFLVLRHIRDVRVLQSLTMGNLTGFSLVPDAVDEPRLKLFGGASTFAQCIMPDEDFADFNVAVDAASPHEPGWSLSPILRLDDNLREADAPAKSIPVFTGNVVANAVLLERNVFQAAAFLVADMQNVDDRELDTPAKAALAGDLRKAMGSITAGRLETEAEYRSLTGVQLPQAMTLRAPARLVSAPSIKGGRLRV